MRNIFEWIKNNKFASFVIVLLLGYIFLPKGLTTSGLLYGVTGRNMYDTDYDMMSGSANPNMMGDYGMPFLSEQARPSNKMLAPSPLPPQYPISDSSNRMMMTSGNLAVQVESVNQTLESLKSKTQELGGYVVSVHINRPEFGESASLTVRVPSDMVESFMAFARSASVKVVSENMSGTDITDEYVDVQTRMEQLEEQKAMLEAILRQATNVDELMKVRPYLTQVQNEIDNLVGREQYLEGASKTSLITINLATDELSLPYQPVNSWRPSVIFKNATRSLMVNLQRIGSFFIWLGVYSVLIVPAITLGFVLITAKKKRNNQM